MDGITDSMDMGLGGLRVGDGQGGLACCSSWGRRESDATELTELNTGTPWGKEVLRDCPQHREQGLLHTPGFYELSCLVSFRWIKFTGATTFPNTEA